MAYSRASQQQARLMAQTIPTWRFELSLALSLLAAGLLLVPLAAYWAGSMLAGDYAGDRGLWGLMLDIWGDAGRGRLAAWTLLLSPYLLVQLVRGSVALWRPRRAVTEITNIENKQ